MKVAIVGTGVSGLVAAYYLQHEHEITLFESESKLGGHVHTVPVVEADREIWVDTGFIVFNRHNYPGFTGLLEDLGVRSELTSMSFSVSAPDMEYRGSSLNTLFAQRRNLVNPRFYRMLRDLVRFYREANDDVKAGLGDTTMKEYLSERGYSEVFRDRHLLPMASALWSQGFAQTEEMPLRFFVSFFENHGMLSLRNRPEWRVVSGGSKVYVDQLSRGLKATLRLETPVRRVTRTPSGVSLETSGEGSETFDRVVFGCHSNQALNLLSDPTPQERSVLGAIRYSPSRVLLHRDTSLLPRRKRAWSSWNYRVSEASNQQATTTYYMNMLQNLSTDQDYCVTLNDGGQVDPSKILQEMEYWHPVFDRAALEAQDRVEEVSGVLNTHYCGAYWGYGFHEDGVQSGIRVVRELKESLVYA